MFSFLLDIEILIFLLINIFSIIFIKKITNLLNLIDYAEGKIHKIDTPKFGLQAFITILIYALVILISDVRFNDLIIILYIFSFILIGYFDDVYKLSVSKRFIYAFLTTFLFFSINPLDFYVSNSFPFLLNFILLIFFTLGFIHLNNMTDGLNGLLSSIFFYSMFYYYLKIGIMIDPLILLLIKLSIASFLVFIIPNFLGICFLGNTGSYLVAIISSLVYMEVYKYGLLEYSDILLIFIVPLIDALRVTCTRLINKENPFKGDFSHMHHMIRNLKKLKLIYFIFIFCPSFVNYINNNYSTLIGAITIVVYFIFYNSVKKIMVASGGLEPPRE